MTGSFAPLADRMRPRYLKEYTGQSHLLGTGKPLHRAISGKHLHSMIFWGGPGTGKTTLARIIAHECALPMLAVSAVLSGVKEIRSAVTKAQERRQHGQATLLFVDEVHRFNKTQQDAFLPHVEDGTIFLVGATTENPSFELNNALLSRVRVYRLTGLTDSDMAEILQRALGDPERGLGQRELSLDNEALALLIKCADGDARQALNLLEIASDLVEDKQQITKELVKEVTAQSTLRRFDKGGDIFHEQISALHKSVRGSNPHAALYWLSRMLDGGCDPHYIARRVLRMASEDIGNADPRGLQIALDAWMTYERLGSPEGELAIAQAVIYLACAAKSNASYLAFKAAMQDAKAFASLDVPMHLRNAFTDLMKREGYGAGYHYSHDDPNAFSGAQAYFPDKMGEKRYYFPVERGLESKIKDKLDGLQNQSPL